MTQPGPGDRLGRYLLGEVIGRGGMGVVLAATDTGLDRPVAVKVLSDTLASSAEFRARFARETATLARLDSPHVIGIYDHGEHPGPGGTPYLVTRLVHGGDLGSLLRSRGPLPARLAVRVCEQVAEALRDAHAAGVVHRDVKPANVLLRDPDEPDPFAYLCDFGIATIEGTSLTRTDAGVSGTWTYLSPERIGGAPATAASDLYALGCLLWAALTGRAPYVGSDFVVAQAHREAPVPRLPGHDPATVELNRFLAVAMAKDPRERLGDAEVARAALARLSRDLAPAAALSGGAVPVGVAPGVAAGWLPRRRSLLPVLAAVLVLLVGTGVAGAVAWDRTRSDDPPGPAASDRTDDDTGDQTGDEPAPVTGDVDGDGLGDVVVQVGRNRDARLLTFRSDASSLAEPEDRAGWPGTSLLGDVDGDGRADVVTPGAGPDDDVLIRVDLATGERSRSSVANAATGSGVTSTPFLTDLEGDGRLGLALAGEIDGALRLRTADLAGESGLVTRELPASAGSGLLRGSDVDGDGSDELVVVSQDRSVADTLAGQVLRPDGGELVEDGSPFPLGPSGTDLLLNADTDGDGAEELVRFDLESDTQELQTYDASSDSGAERTWEALEPTTVEDVDGDLALYPAVSDLDGDGDDDVVLLRRVGSEVLLDAFLAEDGALVPNGPWGVWACGASCSLTIDGIGSSG